MPLSQVHSRAVWCCTRRKHTYRQMINWQKKIVIVALFSEYYRHAHPRIPRGDSARYINPWDNKLNFLRCTVEWILSFHWLHHLLMREMTNENDVAQESGYLIGSYAITLRIEFRWQVRSFSSLLSQGLM